LKIQSNYYKKMLPKGNFSWVTTSHLGQGHKLKAHDDLKNYLWNGSPTKLFFLACKCALNHAQVVGKLSI
jgi:hypothetical protein